MTTEEQNPFLSGWDEASDDEPIEAPLGDELEGDESAVVDRDQFALFDPGEKWEVEWRSMPEFHMRNLKSYRSLIVHLRSPEDAAEFAELLEQPLLESTKSIWYPRLEWNHFINKRYIDAPREGEEK